MGIDGMRVGGGRCPPLVVAGLIVACFLLVCNWWSLSTENTELLRQIDGLSEQLKLSVEQRDQCITLRNQLENRYKKTEEDIATLHYQLGQENDSIKFKDEAITMCNIELDSLKKLDVTKTATVETLRLEKETINGQLEEKKEDNKKLQDELEKVQDELNRLKLSQETTGNKKSPVPDSPAAGDATSTNDAKTKGNQDKQDFVDGIGNQGQSNENEVEIPENPEDDEPAQESARDKLLMIDNTEPDIKPTQR